MITFDASATAVSRPIPVEAPVTTTFCPSESDDLTAIDDLGFAKGFVRTVVKPPWLRVRAVCMVIDVASGYK